MSDSPQNPGTPQLACDTLKQFLPEMLESSVQKAHFEHSLARPGPFDGQLLHLTFDGITFDTGSYSRSVYCRGEMPSNGIILGFASSKYEGGQFNGSKITSATPVVYAEGSVLDTLLLPHTQWVGFQVPRTLLQEAGVMVPDDQAGAVKFDPQRLMELTRTLDNSLQLFTELAHFNQLTDIHKAQIRSQLEGIIAMYAGALNPEPQRELLDLPVQRLRVVGIAREHIEAHYHEVIRVSELSKLTDISFRTLERAFKTVLGMSPQRYLTAVRLSKARQKLLASDGQLTYVSDVATACGCFHLGRFAQDYRKMFGETPSQTLKRLPEARSYRKTRN